MRFGMYWFSSSCYEYFLQFTTSANVSQCTNQKKFPSFRNYSCVSAQNEQNPRFPIEKRGFGQYLNHTLLKRQRCNHSFSTTTFPCRIAVLTLILPPTMIKSARRPRSISPLVPPPAEVSLHCGQPQTPRWDLPFWHPA